MVIKFEPVHARQLITEKRLKHREVCKKHVTKKSNFEANSTNSFSEEQKSTKKNVVKNKHTKKEESLPRVYNKKIKTFSLLWGLIKFNY